MHYQIDYLYGKEQEKKVYPILKEHFDENLTQSPDHSKHDFESDTVTIELKSRKCNFNTYPTTLLTCNKIVETSKRQIFCFNFQDGIYYIEYDPKLFDQFLKKSFSRSRRSGDYKMYYYIPIEDLTLIK